jgi:hypothetical protein
LRRYGCPYDATVAAGWRHRPIWPIFTAITASGTCPGACRPVLSGPVAIPGLRDWLCRRAVQWMPRAATAWARVATSSLAYSDATWVLMVARLTLSFPAISARVR